MDFGQKLKKLRKEKDITQQELANLLKVGRSTIAGYETKGKNPDYDKLQKLAIYFDVSIDYLVGESASSIIEDKLEELGMTLEELAEKSKVPLRWLQNLDTFIPGEADDWDDSKNHHELDWNAEIGGYDGYKSYKWITQVAEVLGLPGSRLRAALERQAIPAYDGPTSTPEEDFFDEEPVTKKMLEEWDKKYNPNGELAEHVKFIESLNLGTPEEALEFLLSQPVLSQYGDYDLDSMSEEEIMDLVNNMLLAMKLSIEKKKGR